MAEMTLNPNLRHVAHPEHLYIQVNDEDEHTLSFSFNDNPEELLGLDPNAFDDATLLRCEQILANVFMCIHKLRTGEEPIKPLKKD